MRSTASGARRCARLVLASGVVLAAAMSGLTGAAATAPLTVLGVNYQQDEPFSEYQCLWHDRDYPASCGVPAAVGANVHAYLRNDGASAVTVSDVTLAGYSLNRILRAKIVGDHLPLRSIYHYWDNPPQDILDAGEPVWYKADPATIPPGGVAQVVVRLRFAPVNQPVSLGIVTSAGTLPVPVPVAADSPQLASVSFSPDLSTVYLHWRRADGASPATILMDGVDVTASTTTVGDSTLDFGATAIQLEEPLAPLSYHVFQGVYHDGSTASASTRTWVNPFVYGTWGARPLDDSDLAGARAWIDDATNRGVNSLIANMSSGGLANLLRTAAGRQYAADRGYGFVPDTPGYWTSTPRLWFIDDEPDAEEANVPCGPGYRIPCGGGHTVGILAMSMVKHGEDLRRAYPLAPTMINMDNGWKPSNWYTYGQLPDVLGVDSYYQKRLSDTYWYWPQRAPLYRKATVIYASSLALTRAAEPNPTQFLLYSNQIMQSPNYWPFPTTQSKRIEAYYALAGGAKGMAYWWYKPPTGLGAGGPGSQALWKEIGLLGNEIKTAAPLLVASHPVALPVQGSAGVWVKSLAVGIDTLILIAVNDQYYNDPAGFHSTPVANATVTATLPSWISSPTAFEISADGLSHTAAELSGDQIQLSLGTLDLTRMIVVTTNPELKATLQQRYDDKVSPGICAFAPEHCGTQPTIAQHPVGVAAAAGEDAAFTVSATGGNLRYRWQKDGIDVSDGDGLSGVTTATLRITGVQARHAGAYRCAVSNRHGSAFSNAATLSVSATPPTITGQPIAQSVCPGGTAAFSVSATGEGPLSYRWQRNGVDLADGGHYSGAATATLTVAAADGSDAASYRCVVANTGGSTPSNEAALGLRAATLITQQPPSQTVAPNGTAAFAVGATGEGPLGYRWQKNRADLVDGGHYSGTATATLTVSGADSGDQASYRSVATAACGSATSNEATLTVKSDACHASVAPDRWRGEYFPNTTLSGPASLVRDDGASSLSFDWGRGGPSTCGIGTDSFSVRWTRTAPFAAGTYRFTVTGDDGVRLYIDGALKLDKWILEGPTTYNVDAALGAGNHTVTFEYFENTGGATAKLSWTVLASACVAAVAADRWKGEYFPNTTLSGPPFLVRDDGASSLGFDWGRGGPSTCGIGTDAFSIRWARTVSFPAGTHRFTVTSDDGVRLYLDGARKLDKWFLQGPTTYTVDAALVAGNHTLTMEYFENTGNATAKLSWTQISTTPPPTAELRRYWVKPDWLSPNWGYRPRGSAPAPAVNRSGEIDDRTSFRRARLNEEWQWFWADLLSLSKFRRGYAELTVDQQAFISRSFGGLTGDHLAFTNNAGSSTKNCYPCGQTDRGEDMKIDPLICGGNTVFGGDPVPNARGQWMVKVHSFDASQPPPVATLDMLDDPRVLWATIISTTRYPDGSYHLFGFPQLKDGTPVPYPYMTAEPYYYPLEELEEYSLTDPKRPIYNP